VVQPNGSSWVKLAQVGQVEQVEAGLQIYVGQVGQEQRGLQIDVEQVGQEQGVCPAEPLHLTHSGTARPWKFSSAEEVDLSFKSETKEHPKISNPSFWKRDRENIFLQNVLIRGELNKQNLKSRSWILICWMLTNKSI